MGSGKRRQPRRRKAAKPQAVKSTGDLITIGSSNPFPICAVPSSIPSRYRHVVENLSSHVALHRAISCSALSNIIGDDKRVATELIGAGIVPIVLPMLIDADTNVAVHAGGLLRNLAVADGNAFAGAVQALDAFGKIVALVLSQSGQRSASWTAEVLAIVACLTEHDNDLTGSTVVGDGSIWNLSLLSTSTEAAVAVLEVFRNLVDDRPELAQSLIDRHLPAVQDQLGHSSALVRAHAAALLAAIARLLPQTTDSFLTLIAPHLRQGASIDLVAATRALIQDGRQARAEIDAELQRQRAAHTGETIFQESIGGRLAAEALDHAWRNLFESFRELAISVQIAAETVANLTCVDPDERTWDLRRIAEMIGVYQLAPVLATRIQTVLDDDRLEIDDWHRVVDLVDETIERCIESMINLVLNEVVPGAELIDLVLGVIEREACRPQPKYSLLEVAARLLALLLASSAKDLFPNQIQMLTSLSRAPVDVVRQEFVSVLAKFGSQSPSKADSVADHVCERLQDESMGVFLESINGVIDMFSEDGVHMKTLARLNLLSVLKNIESDERRWSSYSVDLEEELLNARENLLRFIQYRSSCP